MSVWIDDIEGAQHENSFRYFCVIYNQKSTSKALMKTVESDFRPQVGDIIDDPGFDRKFHNGYEVVKVTVNYAEQECFASLAPLVVEQEEMEIEKYLNKLEENGWWEMPNDKMN